MSICGNSLVAQSVKNLLAKKKNLLAVPETWLQSLGWEWPLDKEMAAHGLNLPFAEPDASCIVGKKCSLPSVQQFEQTE